MKKEKKNRFKSDVRSIEREKEIMERGGERSASASSVDPPNVHIQLNGVAFHLNKEVMASRSAKLAALLQSQNHLVLTSDSVTSIPAGPETFELAVRFCYGQDPGLSADTVIPLACAASYLEMTEDRSPDNLLKLAISFLTDRVLPHWNETLRAVHAAAPALPYAQHLGLVDACLRSITEKALADPTLIGDPLEESTEDSLAAARTGVKRRLFVVDRFAEDLTSLTLPIYELAVSALIRTGAPAELLAQCIYRYMKRWVDQRIMDGSPIEVSVYEKSKQREVIEAVERLLPGKPGLLHVGCLFEMLRSAILLQAGKKCRDGFEARIGKQLPQASADDLRVPCYDYTKETKYDVRCVDRMVDHFCSSYQPSPDLLGLKAVLGRMETFMAEAAVDENLSKGAFVALLEKLAAMGRPIGRCHDGLYRAIDVYLDAHGHVTEAEREEICRAMDCYRLSGAACEHAAQNERMPLRTVAQVLFVGQRRIREAIAGAAISSEGWSEEEKKVVVVGGGGGGDHDPDDGDYVDEEEEEEEEEEMEMRKDMTRMDIRVMGLESECVRMRGDIEKGRGRRREGWGLWKEMKDLLGCKSGPHELNSCQWVKKEKKQQKVHPKKP